MTKPSLKDLEKEASAKADPGEALALLRRNLSEDPRKAARSLLRRYERRVEKRMKESARLEVLWRYERGAQEKGARSVAGIDEAGRGPLVGPVVAAAVILPRDADLPGLDDSKKLTAQNRERLHDAIRGLAEGVGVGQASAREIDEHNIYRASQLAMERAVAALPRPPDHLLLDAMRLPSCSHIPQDRIVHGDALSASVAAASIVAKVTRDRLLLELDAKFPMYGFARHKGYGTAEHLEALRLHGPCPEHRRSFGPVAAVVGGVPDGAGFDYWKGRIEAAADPEALEEAGRMIRVVGRKKMDPEDVQRLRDLYRKKREELS